MTQSRRPPRNFTCVSWNIPPGGRGMTGEWRSRTRTDPASSFLPQPEVAPQGLSALIPARGRRRNPAHGRLSRSGRDRGGDAPRPCSRRRHPPLGRGQPRASRHGRGFLHPSAQVEAVVLVELPGHCHRERRGRGFSPKTARAAAPCRHGICPLARGLRMAQMRTIGQHLFRRDPRLTILAGDLNVMAPLGAAWPCAPGRVLGMAFHAARRPRPFRCAGALLPLDRG